MKTAYILTLLLVTMLGFDIKAQTFSHKELYDSDFVFTDGLYLTKEDFKNNCPIDKSRINTSLDPTDLTFFEQLVQQKEINFFDNVGSQVSIKPEKLFGFCSAGTIYVLVNGTFARIGIVGSICHFLGQKTVYNTNYSPYFGYYGRYPYSTVPSQEPQQYILSFETGDILEYTSENMLTLLMADPQLHDEFAELSRKKRNSKMFYYMRLFNEKHPLYIPVYE